jgi:hypothetical protein
MLNLFEDSMKNFTIDEEHLCSVMITEYHSRVKDKNNPTPEELFDILKKDNHWSSLRSDDHPKFAELREELGRKKYIEIQRGWWNGDRVLKPFRLNGYLFIKDDKFSSGAAMGHHLEFAKEFHPERLAKNVKIEDLENVY